MKNYFKAVLLIALTIGLSACPDNGSKKKSSISPYRGQNYHGQNPVTQPGAQPGINTPSFTAAWGEVTQSHLQQDGFQSAVYGFVSPTDDPVNLIGTVSGLSGQSTGVRLAGMVSTQNGQPRSGQLIVLISDSWALSGQRPAVAVSFNYVSGNISMSNQNQGTATVTFQDNEGVVQMQGNFTNYGGGSDYFQGTISYQNNKYWDGQTPGHQDVLGEFRVPTCNFFTCN